ncbi:MAG: winged helix-turn-helix transcriptional regulator, partial [Candidatus Woesearchaeota archaeon]
MIKKKDLLIASYLRQNCRIPLTKLARRIGIPVSTIFDRLRSCEGSFIEKQTALLNFQKLGYNTRATVLLKVK